MAVNYLFECDVVFNFSDVSKEQISSIFTVFEWPNQATSQAVIRALGMTYFLILKVELVNFIVELTV
jgi:hypothetical protein